MYCTFRLVLFNISIVLVSNASYKEFRGTIMGLSQTIGSLGRFIGPTLIPPLYAWSCHKNTTWINHRLSFYAIAFMVLLNFIPIAYLSESCNKGRGSITSTVQHRY